MLAAWTREVNRQSFRENWKAPVQGGLTFLAGLRDAGGAKDVPAILHTLLIGITNKNKITNSSVVRGGLTFFPEEQHRLGQARQTKQHMKQIRPDEAIPLLAS